MSEHFFFFVGLAFILTHEMDAIRAREWAIFPGLSRLEDKTGFIVFMLLHVPLYVLLLVNVVSTAGLNSAVIHGLDVFFIVHVFLHILYLKHPKNEFKSALSWVLIVGAGLGGLLDLGL